VKIEVGKYYKNRDGMIEGPLKVASDGLYCFANPEVLRRHVRLEEVPLVNTVVGERQVSRLNSTVDEVGNDPVEVTIDRSHKTLLRAGYCLGSIWSSGRLRILRGGTEDSHTSVDFGLIRVKNTTVIGCELNEIISRSGASAT